MKIEATFYEQLIVITFFDCKQVSLYGNSPYTWDHRLKFLCNFFI